MIASFYAGYFKREEKLPPIPSPVQAFTEIVNDLKAKNVRESDDELKENNRILISIYKKISKKYYKKDYNNDNLQNKINDWFKKNDSNNFHLNLTKYIFNI